MKKLLFIGLCLFIFTGTTLSQVVYISEFYRDPSNAGGDIDNTSLATVEAGEFIELFVSEGGDIDGWLITDYDAYGTSNVIGVTSGVPQCNIGAKIKAVNGGTNALVNTGDIIILFLGGSGLPLTDSKTENVYKLYLGNVGTSSGILSNATTSAGDPIVLLNASQTTMDFVYYGSTGVNVDGDITTNEKWGGWPHDGTNLQATSSIAFSDVQTGESAKRFSTGSITDGALNWAGNEIPSPGSNDSGLPVELSSFSVSPVHGGALLKWETASEVNNAGFEILKNGEPVAFINGKGNTTEKQSYQWMDKAVSGQVTYQLRQTDTDGKMTLSEILTFTGAAGTFEVEGNYPNPFNPETKIRFNLAAESQVLVKVSNIIGQEIAVLANEKMTAGKKEIRFNAANLASGVYFYSVTANGKTITRSMTLMK